MTKVGIIGCGYWGQKLLERLLLFVPEQDIKIADVDEDVVNRVAREHSVSGTWLKSPALRPLDVSACIIATPISTHYDIARTCLESGQHVLVEKPMAKSVIQARYLADLAEERHLVLATDLTFLHNPKPIKQLAELASRVPAPTRLRFIWGGGRSRHPEDGIWWTWGPHPVSIMLHLCSARKPMWVMGHIGSDLVDVTYGVIPVGVSTSECSGLTEVNISMTWGPDVMLVRTSIVRTRQEGKWTEPPVNLADVDGESQLDPLGQVVKDWLDQIALQNYAPDALGVKTVEVLEWTEQQLKSH